MISQFCVMFVVVCVLCVVVVDQSSFREMSEQVSHYSLFTAQLTTQHIFAVLFGCTVLHSGNFVGL